MLIAALVYIWLPEAIKRDAREGVDNIFFLIVGIMAITCAGSAFIVRNLMIERALEPLRAHPEDRSAFLSWFAGNTIVFCLCEAIVLQGFALRFIGATLVQSVPLYATGILLFLLFYPRRP